MQQPNGLSWQTSLDTGACARRNFLKVLGVGGAMAMLPAMLTSCGSDSTTGPRAGSGTPLTIDFANGDYAVLQFAFVLEQLEADFYTRAVADFGSSNLSTTEQDVLGDIRNHELIHREFLKAALGATYGFTITPTYPGENFKSRSWVLSTAASLEDLGIAAYNGAAQYIADVGYLTLAGKIVSVEGRHASAIHDLAAPKTSAFSPSAFENAYSVQTAAGIAQGFIIEKLTFANAPSASVQSPHTTG